MKYNCHVGSRVILQDNIRFWEVQHTPRLGEMLRVASVRHSRLFWAIHRMTLKDAPTDVSTIVHGGAAYHVDLQRQATSYAKVTVHEQRC